MLRWILNIITNYLKTLIGMVIVFFMTPFIISKLGMDLFGLWSLVFAVVGVFGLMDFGFATAAVKYVAEYTGAKDLDGRNAILSTLLVVYSLIGIVCLVLVAIVAGPASGLFDLTPAQERYFTTLVWLLGAVVAFSFPAGIFKAAMVGSGRMDVVNIIELLMQLTNAGLIVWWLSAGHGILGLAAATAITMSGTLLVLIPLAYRMLPRLKVGFRGFSQERVRELMSFSVYAFIANVAMLVILRIDPIVIGLFMPLTSIAIYAIAGKITEYTYLLNKQFSNALMPLVSQSHGSGDRQTIRRVMLDGTRFLMGIALPFIGLLYFYAPEIIAVWVGHDFDDSVPLLRILLVAVAFSTTQLNVANVLGMTGSHRFVAFSMAASAIVNLVLSVVLIQFFGLYGVAFGTLIAAFLIELAIMVPRACREQGVSPWAFFSNGIFPGIPALLPMFAAAWALEAWRPAATLGMITAEGATAAAVYLLGFWFTAVRREERAMVKQAVRSRLQRLSKAASRS